MEVSSEDSYRYQPLSAADSVRLLRISRADDQPHGMLLSLEEVRLDGHPDFAALSYTWKLPEYDVRRDQDCGALIEVICDGKLMTISENLFNFLCAAMRATEVSNETSAKLESKVNGILKDLPLWIDAFCINQNDSEEKRHQVLLMHRIYSAARNVIVWLGPAQPPPDVLWVHDKFIPAISKAERMKPKFTETRLKKDPLCSSMETMQELGPELCSRWLLAWLEFFFYFDRQCWFDRGWIVQEVALSDPANVYICCGRSALRWKRLAAFAQFLHETGWSSALQEHIEKTATTGDIQIIQNRRAVYPLQVSSRILKISQARAWLAEVAQHMGHAESAWNSKLDQNWLDCANVLVDSLRSSRFGDDRDHIYGCLGMLSMLLPQGYECPILPNYESTVEEVFTDTAGLFLTNTPLLTELSRMEEPHLRRYYKLPSWVPDYSARKGHRIVASWNFPINRYLNMSVSELRDTESKLWGCDLRRPKLVRPVLCVHGFWLDTILEVAAEKPFQWQSRDIATLIEKSGPESVGYNGFWKTLSFAYQCLMWGEDPYPYERLLDQIEDDAPRNPPARTKRQRVKDSRTSGLEHPQNVVWTELANRTIYGTEGGELGLGPITVRQADEVWLLEGSRTPCILRRADFTSGEKLERENQPRMYKFIGETDLRSFDIQSTHLTSEASRGFYEEIGLA